MWSWYPFDTGIMNRSNPIPTAAPHVFIAAATQAKRKSQKHGASFLPRTVLNPVLGFSVLSPTSRTTEFEVQIPNEFYDKHPQ